MGNAPTEAPGRAGDAFGVAAAVAGTEGLFERSAPSDPRARDVETGKAGEDGIEFTAGCRAEALSGEFSSGTTLVPAAGAVDGVRLCKTLARDVDGARAVGTSARGGSTSPTNCDAAGTAAAVTAVVTSATFQLAGSAASFAKAPAFAPAAPAAEAAALVLGTATPAVAMMPAAARRARERSLALSSGKSERNASMNGSKSGSESLIGTSAERCARGEPPGR
jgi:hypothetical protein